MLSRQYSLPLTATLLMLALLGAQLHLCADFAGNSGTHVCQVCANAGHAATVQLFAMELAPAIRRLEAVYVPSEAVSVVLSAISPRAPPAL